jgi:hypothetical protein
MRKTCYSQETAYIRLHLQPDGKNHRYHSYPYDISGQFRAYGVNRISPLSLEPARKPELAGRTRLRRRWLIFTHGNGFDQGEKKL